jgi:predicted nucleic acid-binding protein
MAITIIADTSGIIALLDQSDKHHRASIKAISNCQILLPNSVIPEVDYLVTKYLGERVARCFLSDVLNGYYKYTSIELEDINRIIEIMALYRDLPLGFVDASIITLAERLQIRKILTLDRRHFNLVKPSQIDYFELLP